MTPTATELEEKAQKKNLLKLYNPLWWEMTPNASGLEEKAQKKNLVKLYNAL